MIIYATSHRENDAQNAGPGLCYAAYVAFKACKHDLHLHPIITNITLPLGSPPPPGILLLHFPPELTSQSFIANTITASPGRDRLF
jgi:hypothetical protein